MLDGLERLREAEDDLLDLSLLVGRTLTATERTISLDAVLSHFGFTREELLAEEFPDEAPASLPPESDQP